MNFIVKSPTLAEINATDEEIRWLTKELSYKNMSAHYEHQKHLQRHWLERRDPEGFQAESERLKNEVNKTLIFYIDGKPHTYPGIIPYIEREYSVSNYTVSYPQFKPIPWAKPLPFEPYFYQQESMEKLMAVKHGHISLPTGAGKSLVLLMIARNAGLRTVISTPSQSIFSELLDLFEKHLGKGKVGAYGDGKKNLKAPITIAINRSLSMLKEGTEAWDFFANKQLMAVDESHQVAANELEKTANGVLKDIPYRMFVSGTQVRGDGKQILLNSIIGPCVKEMSLIDGIQQGFLCPLKFKILKTFSPSTVNIKDPIECKREHFLRNPNIAELAAKIANASWNVKQESTLILVEELEQIAMLKRLITVPMTYVHSGSKKEAEVWGLKQVDAQEEIERFNLGEVKVLIGSRAIAVGVNLYPVHNTINFVGGASEVTTKQGCMGRSTRKLENSRYRGVHKPKPFTTIFDFDVQGQPILKNHLKKRIEFYEEAGEDVVY